MFLKFNNFQQIIFRFEKVKYLSKPLLIELLIKMIAQESADIRFKIA